MSFPVFWKSAVWLGFFVENAKKLVSELDAGVLEKLLLLPQLGRQLVPLWISGRQGLQLPHELRDFSLHVRDLLSVFLRHLANQRALGIGASR